MALNPQFPNYANGAAGTEVIFYTVVGGLPLYRLPAKLVDTGFGAALVGGGSTPYPPDSNEFSPPSIVTPGALNGIFIEGETITHSPAVVTGDVTSQTVTWWIRKNTGSVKVAENVSTYTLQAADVDGFLYVEVYVEGPYGSDSDTTQSYGPILPDAVPVPVLTATFTPSDEVGTDASLAITACTNGTVTRVQVLADQTGVIQDVAVSALPVTVTQSGASLVPYVGQYLIFKVAIADGSGNVVNVNYTCGPIVGTAPVISGTGTIAGMAKVGETLTFTPPSVTGTPTPTVTYNWYRQGGGTIIAGGLTYVPTNDDLGKTLYVTTVATNLMGGSTATTSDFGPILGTAPEVVDPGVLSPSSVRFNEVITLSPIPSFNGNPAPSVSWVWRDAFDASRILQMGGTTYRAKTTDVGKSIVVSSTATNLSGSTTASTNEASVAAEAPTVLTPSVLFNLNPQVRQSIGAKKATFEGYPEPFVTSFGFWDYTDPMNPFQLVDGKDVTTYAVKDEDFGKEIAFVTVAENSFGTATSISTVSAPVAGFLTVTGKSQLSYEAPVEPGTVLSGGQASFEGVPSVTVSQYGFAYDNGNGTYTPILSSVGQTSYTVVQGDIGKAVAFYTTATNAAVPAGLTSYSTSTGPIGDTFEFVSTGGVVSAGPAPIVGETLTINYAVTVPRNQKNVPPGPVVLSWNWISDTDPTVPLTTANALTYVVKPADYGNRIGLTWTATHLGETLKDQSAYSNPVGGNAPAVLTTASIAGNVSNIPSTLTLTPATFSGSNVTTSWVWVDNTGKEWKTGGNTLVTNSSMAGVQMCVKTTATNFAGSVTDTSNFSDIIGGGDLPVFTYNGTVTGATVFPTVLQLDPAKATAPSSTPVVTWNWYFSAVEALTDAVLIPGTENQSTLNTADYGPSYLRGTYVFVESVATTPAGTATTRSNAIGPLGLEPVAVDPGTINGEPTEATVLTLNPAAKFAGEQPITVDNAWIVANRDGSDEVIIATNVNSVTVPSFSARFRYIFVRSTGYNDYGSATQTTPAFGPIQPNLNPIVTKPGVITGEMVNDGSDLTYLLPTIYSAEELTSEQWNWVLFDPDDATFKEVVLQNNGTFLSLNTSWVRDPLYNQIILGKRIKVIYEAKTARGRAVYDTAVTPKPLTFVPWMMDKAVQNRSNFIYGGQPGPDAWYVQPGQTLTYENFTGGFYENLQFTQIDKTLPAPTSWVWYYDPDGGNDGHIYSTNVTDPGCYVNVPRVYADALAVAPARLKAVPAPTFGVYGVACGFPSAECHADEVVTWTVAPPAGGGVAPTIRPRGFVTTFNDWTYVTEFEVLTPGSGYTPAADPTLEIFADGVAYTQQVFTWQKGYTIQEVQIVYAGYGYTQSSINLVFETNEDDDFPATGTAQAPTDTVILQEGGTSYTLPTDDLGPVGKLGVVSKVSGLNSDTPPLYTGAVNTLRYAPHGSTSPQYKPQAVNPGSLYGNVAAGSRGLGYRPTYWGNWSNPNFTSGDAAALMTPAEAGTSYPIAPHTVEIRWVWYSPGSLSKVTFQTGGTRYNFLGQADEPPANSWIQVIETATNDSGVTVTESLPSWWGGYSGSAAPSPFIPGNGYLSFESSATSQNYTVTVSFGAQVPSGESFPSGISGSYTNTGVNPANVRIKLCAVDYTGAKTETLVGNDVAYTQTLNNVVVAFYAIAYDSTNPSVYVRLPVVGVPPLAWYVSRGMNANLIANAAAKKAAYVSGTGSITSYMSNGNLSPTPGIFCATGELNALRAYYRTPPTVNIPVTGCPSGQIPFGAYRGFLSGGKAPSDVYTVFPARASCQYANVSGYYREIPAFDEYFWAFANPPSKIQTALVWQWGFYTPETPDDIGIRGYVETYIGPDKLGVSPEPQWVTPASIKFNPAWKWSAGFQTGTSDIGPWSPVSGFLTAGTYVRWSLYNQPPSNYLDPRTGTPLNSGGEWWVVDADGTNPVRVAGSLVGWQQTLRIQEAWLGKNLYFKQVATPAGECTETAVSLEPVYVVGYISASKLIPRPVPPVA